MIRLIRSCIKSIINRMGFIVVNKKSLQSLRSNDPLLSDLSLILMNPFQNSPLYLKYKSLSKSQFHQDMFVLSELGFKRDGFFVEFGASNGELLSNTHLLEKHFDWKGILAEPGKTWIQNLKQNRSAFIEDKCVWSKTGEALTFCEVSDPALSTIEGCGEDDNHDRYSKKFDKYEVQSISLYDLLLKYKAPKYIDYISIDTEGSEFTILEHFDFEKFKVKIFTIEHNHSPSREKIFKLMSSKNYKRVYQNISRVDDWYILDESNK